MTSPFGLQGPELVHAIHLLPDDSSRSKWESQRISILSPCVVDDSEEVVRALDQPVHVGVDGNINPAAFTDVGSRGLSVNRREYCELGTIKHCAAGRAEHARQRNLHAGKPDNGRRVVALVHWSVKALRALRTDDGAGRLVGVYDSALPGSEYERSHADVVTFLASKAAERRARRLLYEQAKGRVEWLAAC